MTPFQLLSVVAVVVLYGWSLHCFKIMRKEKTQRCLGIIIMIINAIIF